MKNSVAGSSQREISNLDVAIIGMYSRVPGANSIEQFWENLKNGKESLGFLSDEELQAAALPEYILKHPNFVKSSGKLNGIDLFDAAFFGISPREAVITDPQRRLFLEGAWETFERAGYDPSSFKGLIGVYASIGSNTYLADLSGDTDLLESVGWQAVAFTNERGAIATATSYKLNLKGPSLAVQTACSSSLVATHLAYQAILTGECDMALAGSASVSTHPFPGYFYEEGGILSPDGHCRAFDAKAKGTVWGSGVCMLLLKPLEAALEDGDRIHAVIKGSAVGNDGSLKAGFTAPSVDGQRRTIRMAQQVSGIDPATISYVEAHGTGTELGDPIEIEALSDAYRVTTQTKGFCAVGSVKTNVGHLDAAAGAAGVIKAALALEHKQIPPSLHFETPNPKIDFANSPFFVNTQLRDWRGPYPLRAGVNSFGVGGTNAHVILEEAPEREASGESRSAQLLVISAQSENALRNARTNLAEHLKQHEGLSLADTAYTLHVGRKHFAYRFAAVCESREQAIEVLEGNDAEPARRGRTPESEPAIALLFPGQGSQFVNMGRGLYETESLFREIVDRCCIALKPILGLDLRQILFASNGSSEDAQEALKQTAKAQPALFVIEYALARLWMDWGLKPRAMIGHSVGEYVAACIAGVMSEQEALQLVAERARLMQEMLPGSMLAVMLTEAELTNRLLPELSLAAVNGENQCVVSGPTDVIERLEKQLNEEDIGCRKLATSHAFHSKMMDPMLERFGDVVKKVKLKAPQLPYISNLTGKWITEREARDHSYWVRHLRESVRFAAGVQTIMQDSDLWVFLEVGPGNTLSGLVRRLTGQPARVLTVASISPEQEGKKALPFLLEAAGKLWQARAKFDWARFYGGQKRHRVLLPTYPFERQRYWFKQSSKMLAKAEASATEKKVDVGDWLYLPVWKQTPPALPIAENDKAEWLIFLDEEGLGHELAKQFTSIGRSMTTVGVGESFSHPDDRSYTIHPRQRADYEKLFTELHGQGRQPNQIVHLWSVTPDNRLPSLEEAQSLGFYSLLFLGDALAKQGITAEIDIAVVSTNLQVVTGEEITVPEKATLQGPCLVIPQEYPNIRCRSIDVVLPQSGTWQRERLLKHLVSELTAKSSDEIIAFRGGQRWARNFEPLRLDAKDGVPARLRPRCVCLITGGLGNIGLEIAEFLAHSVQARLVLMARSSFPAQKEWGQWLSTHGQEDWVSRKILRLQRMLDVGAEVLVARGDVAELDQIRDVVARTHERFGPIHCVIHGAGVLDGSVFRSIQEAGTADCEAHFKPKMHGLLALEEALHGEPLDFCVLLSSLSSILGGLGYCAYAAGNLYLDAFAHDRQRKTSLTWSSLNWDNWNFYGEAADVSQVSMQPKEAIEALRRILSMDSLASQAVISAADLTARMKRWVKGESSKDEALDSSTESSTNSRPELSTDYAAPTNDAESLLCGFWEKLLGVSPIGIDDDFFELGGDSVISIQLVSRARRAGLAIAPKDVIQHPTVKALAVLAKGAKKQEGGRPALRPQPRPEKLPLSYSQQRIWFIDRLQQGASPEYNIPVALRLRGELNIEALRRAIDTIVERHESLRTRFVEVDGNPVQVIAPELCIDVPVEELHGLEPREQEEVVQSRLREEIAKPFDLTRGPLMRVKLLKLGDQEHILMSTVHHIVYDGWSQGVFDREFSILYEAYQQGRSNTLKPLALQYVDFTLWQRELFESGALDRELRYWKEQLAEIPEELDLPKDRPRSSAQALAAGTCSVRVSAKTLAAVKELNQENEATLFMTLLAAFVLLLSRYSGQDDIVVGSPIANRQDVQLEDLIGIFVNSLALRVRLKQGMTFRELLREVRQIALDAYQNQDVPFDRLVGELRLERDMNRTPIYQAVFVLQNTPYVSKKAEGMGIEAVWTDAVPARFDLEIQSWVDGSEVLLIWQYNRNLFDAWRIEQMAQHYVHLLEAAIAAPAVALHELEMMEIEEGQTLIEELNANA